MSILNNSLLLKKAADSTPADPVTRSLRFNRSGSSYLSRTLSSSETSWTVSLWVKRGILSSSIYQHIFNLNGNSQCLSFYAGDKLAWHDGSSTYTTDRLFRDSSAWAHLAVLNNAGTITLYVNGVQETSGGFSSTISSGTAAGVVSIGRFYNSGSGTHYLDGYLSDFYFIEGSAVNPVDNFIEPNNYGGYIPKAYTGEFGTNGFHLEFEDSSDIGSDSTSNSNDFATTYLSSHDVMLDTPTKNYATWNPLDLQETASTAPTFAEGNLSLSTDTSGYGRVRSTFSIPSTGKWYAEFYSTSFDTIGVRRKVGGGWPSGSSDLASVARTGSITNASGTSQSGLASWSSGDRLGVEVDCDANTIQFLKNGSNYGTSESFTHYAEETFFTYTDGSSGTAFNAIANFGQDPTFAGNYTGTPESSEWAHSPSTDFKSLNTGNLDAPSVKPSEHFNTVLYTGTRDNSNSLGATSNPVDEMGFKPELLWIKDRDNQSSNNGSSYSGNYLFDSVQGTGKAINIDGNRYTGSNDFVSNLDGYNGVSSFDSDGFTLDEAEAVNYAVDSDWNGSIDIYERYAAWGWKLGSNGSSSTWASGNTDPTTEKYNDSAGVSVIRRTETSGSGTGVTLNHSLGAAPEFAFLKDTVGNTQNVYVWHKDLDANKYLRFNATSAQTTGSGYFPSGCSTATTFQIGGDIAGVSDYDGWWDIHLYLFTAVESYSKFGKYTGNGDTSGDGPMVYLGFEPALLMIKRIDSSNNWVILDGKRNPSNTVNLTLQADSPSAEGGSSDTYLDFISTGFKVRNTSTANWLNATSGTYIYAAFAESPFKHANAR